MHYSRLDLSFRDDGVENVQNIHSFSCLLLVVSFYEGNLWFLNLPSGPFLAFLFSSSSQSGVRLVRGVVKDVKPQKLILNDGTEVPYGLLVWSTGVGPSPFVKSLELPKSPGGRLVNACFLSSTNAIFQFSSIF